MWSLSYRFRAESYCVEPDEDMRNFSSLLGITPIEISGGDEGEFDLVILSHVLEHQNQPLLLLEKAIASLSPGGVLIIEVPNFEAGDDRGGIEHPMLFTRESLTRLCCSVSSGGAFFTRSANKKGCRNHYLLAILGPSLPSIQDSARGSDANEGLTRRFLRLRESALLRIFDRLWIVFFTAIAKRQSTKALSEVKIQAR